MTQRAKTLYSHYWAWWKTENWGDSGLLIWPKRKEVLPILVALSALWTSLVLPTEPDIIWPFDWLDIWAPIPLIIVLPHFLLFMAAQWCLVQINGTCIYTPAEDDRAHLPILICIHADVHSLLVMNTHSLSCMCFCAFSLIHCLPITNAPSCRYSLLHFIHNFYISACWLYVCLHRASLYVIRGRFSLSCLWLSEICLYLLL